MNISAGRLLRRKIWCAVTAAPVLFPAFLGATIFYFDVPRFAKSAGWVGWASLVLAGFSATKIWFASDKLTEHALDDLQKKARVEHLRYLRGLRRGLRGDRDRRTGIMLKKLQRIYDRLLVTERWNSAGGADKGFVEVRDQAHQLYQSCLVLLERSLEVWRVSREVVTESARSNLNRSREELIVEVEQSIGNLEKTLDHMQTTRVQGETDLRVDALRLRTELDQGLEIARQVEKRMRELEIDLDGREPSR